MESEAERYKVSAGAYAASLVEDGMTVGLGTGSTAAHAVRSLGARVRAEGLHLTGLPTSVATEKLARECGIPLTTFEETSHVDLAIDGADEVDPACDLIKGGGGALLREKVVARRASRVVIVVDPGKLVKTLGVSFPLPVEVVPFAWRPVVEELRRLGGEPQLRRRGEKTYVTDNGNWVLDVRFPEGIPDPGRLERDIDAVPGIVESGLFVGMVDRLVVGGIEAPQVIDTGRQRSR